MKVLKYFFFFLLVSGCIQPYDFEVKDNAPTLVVEAYVSDKSFKETLDFPSDGRFFTVKLSLTGDVTNVRGLPVKDASVSIEDDLGNEWQYQPTKAGIYTLLDSTFEASVGVKYRLRIVKDEDIYESSWESLPEAEVPAIGNVTFTESTTQAYVYESREPMLRPLKVITTYMNVPENNDGKIYYRWTFDPMWIYIAPLNPSKADPGNTCWATNKNYLTSYALQIDNTGGYPVELFTIPTVRNERIFEKFSVLVTQHAMTDDFYFFWKEMYDQNGKSALVSNPPFNLATNITGVNNTKRVSGYFGAVKEQATRWYFNIFDLSYGVTNTLRGDCLVVYGPDGPAPECLDCREYSFGTVTNVKPSWWPR
jgi:hypothetical protein